MKTATCRHCQRDVVKDPDEGWIDPEAGYDDEDGDGIWRTTCDSHDTFIADHEPEPDEDPAVRAWRDALAWADLNTLALVSA